MIDPALVLILAIFLGIIIVIFLSVRKRSITKTESYSTPSEKKVIRPKIDFDNSSISEEKIIPADTVVFREEVISSITTFIRAIPPSALELHPIFDHKLIEEGGAYKYWDIANYSNISIRVKITCADKKGTVIFYFPDGKTIYCNFNFEGEKTVLNSTYYIQDTIWRKRIIKFSKEDLFNQREQPVLINVSSTLSFFEDETPYYDYFLFMDRLIKIDKELGDIEKKTEIVKEFYFRQKEAGRFYFEELREKNKEYKELDEQRRIPEDVKREVWRRDRGQCSDCGSREKLEFHHIIPFSKGGSDTARNIELLCMSCNRKKSNNI